MDGAQVKEVQNQDDCMQQALSSQQQQQRKQRQPEQQNRSLSQKRRPWGAGPGTQATFSTSRAQNWRTVKGSSAGNHGCTKHSSSSPTDRRYPPPPLTPLQQSQFPFGTLTLDRFLPNWSCLIAEEIWPRGAEGDLSNGGNPCDSTYGGRGFSSDPTGVSFDDDTFSRRPVNPKHDLMTVVSRERGKEQGMRLLLENRERCGSAFKQRSSTNHAQHRGTSGREDLRSVGGRRGVSQCVSVRPLGSGVEGPLMMEWPRSRTDLSE